MTTPGVTIVTLPDRDLYYVNPKEWLMGLLYFLHSRILPMTLSSSTKDKDVILSKLVSPKSYPYWTECFTHLTVDPEYNYEILEKMGDVLMNLTFSDFQLALHPTLDQETLSQIRTKYLAKSELRKKSDELNLKNWVRIVKEIDYSTSEDLIEALYGVIFKVGNVLLGKGEGFSLCMNLTINLYKDEKIDLFYKDSKTKIKEIFEKMHWGEKEQFKDSELGLPVKMGDNWSVILRLTPKAKYYIKDIMGKELKTDVIASYTGSQKKNVENRAYDLALETLQRDYGITPDWAIMKAAEEELKLFTLEARAKEKSEGYKGIYFGKQIKSKNDQLLQLLGEEANGRKRILLSITAPKNIPLVDVKKFAINLYAKSGSLTHYKPVVYAPPS